MENKKLLLGIFIGILLGISNPIYSYYTGYTNVCELNARDLEDIAQDAIEDCLFPKDGGYPSC